jgi:hypothetical protein
MFIRTCSPHIRTCSLHFRIMFLYGGGRLLPIIDNRLLSSHGLLQIHAHARLSLRNDNVELSKNDRQQPISKLSELVLLNK